MNKISRYKPTGWKYESNRHSLAAKGISTKRNAFALSDILKKAQYGSKEARSKAMIKFEVRKKTLSIPRESVTIIPLTNKEKLEVQKAKIRANLGQREFRAETIRQSLGSYRPVRGQTYSDFEEDVKNDLNKDIPMNTIVETIQKTGGSGVKTGDKPITAEQFIGRELKKRYMISQSGIEANVVKWDGEKFTGGVTHKNSKRTEYFGEDDDSDLDDLEVY